MPRPHARSDLAALTPYAHAVDLGSLRPHPELGRVLRLGSNENPLGPSPLAVTAMQQAAAEAGRYPQADGSSCIRAIASHFDLPPECIVLGNGGDECIDLLLRILGHCRGANEAAALPDAVLAFRPCFDVYRTQTVLCGLRFIQVPLREDFSLPLERLAHEAQQTAGRVAVVFVTSPDNPSGLATPRESLLALADALPPDAFLLVDEAYVDFCHEPEESSCLAFVSGRANLGVLRTFSKAYGLAGARLGFMALPPDLADIARRAQIPFSVNRFAQAGCAAALEDREHWRRCVSLIRKGREYLLRELRALDCELPQSQANFVMLRPPCSAQALYEHLLAQGILIRSLVPAGLPDWLRVTVGTEEECAAVVGAVGAFLGAAG